MSEEIKVELTTNVSVCSTLHCACFEKGWTTDMMTKVFSIPFLKALTARKDNKDIGMILFTCVAGEAEIITICVDEAYRRLSIGSMLLDKALFLAKKEGAEKFFLEVSVENMPAISLYKRFGFEQTGLRKKYYQTKNGFIDAMTMAVTL
jgi:ribosomal-protein-alanine N-acetyltransferase